MPLIRYNAFGFKPASFSAFDNSGLNTDNEISTTLAAPGISGRIQRLHCYFAGNGQTVTARCVAWLNGGAGICAKSAQFTAPSGSASTGGQTLNEQFMDAKFSLLVNSGALMFLGFWRDASKSSVWSVASTGSFNFQTDTSGDADSFASPSACAPTFTCGDVEMYADINGSDIKRLIYGFPCFSKGKH